MSRNYVSLLLVFLLTIGIGGYVYVTKSRPYLEQIKSLDFVPLEAKSIIQLSEPNQNLEELFSSSLIWNQINKSAKIKELEDFWSITDTSFTRIKEEAKSLVCFNLNDTYHYIVEMNDLQQDSVLIPHWKTKILDKFILVSKEGDWNAFGILNQKLTTVEKDSSFQTLVKTAGNEPAILYQKVNGNWQSYGLTLFPDQFFASGMEVSSVPQLIENGKFDNRVFDILPTEFESVHIKNFKNPLFFEIDSISIDKKTKECNCDPLYSATSWFENSVVWYQSMYDNGQYIVIKIDEIDGFKNGLNDLLPDSLKLTQEDNLVVRNFNQSFDYNKLFDSKIELNHFVRINDFAVFSNSQNELERLIFQYSTNLTISNNEKLLDFVLGNISAKSNEVILKGGLQLGDISISEGISIYQSYQESKELKYNSHLFSTEIKLDGSRTNPKWKLEFDSPLIAKIYVVKNHTTRDNDYLVQDNANTLYFVTPNGEIKWKRNIENPIIGEIKNIDILGNNKYQMVFNTQNKLFVVDILGRDVTNFPVTILDSATANVSAINYSNTKDHRFLVPTKAGIKSIDNDGKLVKGWDQPKPASRIIHDIDYLSIKGRDYLIAHGSDDKLYFYNRKGEVRHKVKGNFGFPKEIIKGSDITKTRAIFLDKKTNTINRQFFSNNPPSVLLASVNIINQFEMVDYYGNNTKEFILVTDTEILIYSENLSLKEKIALPEKVSNIKIFEGGYGYINQFGDLAVVRGKETKIIGGANDFKIDVYKNQLRVLIAGPNDFKLLLL